MNPSKLPSDRSFGILFTVVSALLAGWFFYKGRTYWDIFAGVSAGFLVLALVLPRVLRPLNFVWMKFGDLLGRIVSPIVLGIIFYGAVTPFALVMKLAKRDALARRFDAGARSYWILRDPPGPNAAESFPRQF
jgi:hypothetical protein